MYIYTRFQILFIFLLLLYVLYCIFDQCAFYVLREQRQNFTLTRNRLIPQISVRIEQASVLIFKI